MEIDPLDGTYTTISSGPKSLQTSPKKSASHFRRIFKSSKKVKSLPAPDLRSYVPVFDTMEVRLEDVVEVKRAAPASRRVVG